jgi:hypothetical protein
MSTIRFIGTGHWTNTKQTTGPVPIKLMVPMLGCLLCVSPVSCTNKTDGAHVREDTGLTQSKQPNMGTISFIGTGHWTNTKQTT